MQFTREMDHCQQEVFALLWGIEITDGVGTDSPSPALRQRQLLQVEQLQLQPDRPATRIPDVADRVDI